MLKEKDEKYTERRLKTSPMFLSKAFTFNTYTAFQTHDSLLCAAPAEESKQRGKQAFVWIYKCCLNASTELIPLVCGDIRLNLRCRMQFTENLLWPAWPSPTHCLWSEKTGYSMAWEQYNIYICAEQLMSVSQGWMYHILKLVYLQQTKKNQSKSFFRLWAVCRLWELELFRVG